MSGSVYVDEAELIIAIHKIQHYLNKVLETADQYQSSLNEITNGGAIKDQLISEQLIRLGNGVKKTAVSISSLDVSTNGILSQFLSDVENADTFSYPDSVFSQIRAILAAFL